MQVRCRTVPSAAAGDRSAAADKQALRYWVYPGIERRAGTWFPDSLEAMGMVVRGVGPANMYHILPILP